MSVMLKGAQSTRAWLKSPVAIPFTRADAACHDTANPGSDRRITNERKQIACDEQRSVGPPAASVASRLPCLGDGLESGIRNVRNKLAERHITQDTPLDSRAARD